LKTSPGSLNIKAGPNLTAQLSVDGSEVYTNARIMTRTERYCRSRSIPVK
jgi:hypothetical protein